MEISNTSRLDEVTRQEYLRKHKPRVFEKISMFNEKVENHESIAIVQFQYNFQCNFTCEHCSIAKFQMSRKDERNSGRKIFTLDDVRELSRQADEMGLANFVISGGEPLTFPDLDQLVEAIDPKKFFIVCDSNGWLLDEAKARHLKSIGIDKIQLSVDGSNPELHDAFRRKDGSWLRCIRAIDACQKAGLHLIVSTVVWKDRVRSQDLIDLLEFMKQKGVGTYISYAKPVGAYEGKFDQLVNQEDEDYISELEKKYDTFTHLTPSYGRDIGCIAVKRMVSITRYGDVMPCPYMHISLGNFFEEPLKDIIERGLKIKWFDYNTKKSCIMADDRGFIEKYITKTYGDVQVPVPYDKIFTDEDFNE